MPHVVVTGQTGRPETKIFGLPQKEMAGITGKGILQPFGGRIGQDGQMFQNQVAQVSY